MRVVAEDFVEWEPLVIRFIPKARFDNPSLVVACLESWCQENAANTKSDCDIRFWKVTLESDGMIEAIVEHLTPKSVARLARSIAKSCSELDHIKIGEPLEGFPAGLNFDWVRLPATEIELNGAIHRVDPVAISFSPVTFGQFTEFMKETDYVPVPDTKEYDGYLVEYFRVNYGPSPKTPLFGVTYDDAIAFCTWAHLRLPSEPELHHFFHSLASQGKQSKWSGECWTATSTKADTFVVRNGPYPGSLGMPPERFRKELHRHHYMHLEAPCFRVARSSGGGANRINLEE